MKVLTTILLVVLSYFIVAMIHELGHIITGVLSGFRFEMFAVGPLGIKRNDDGKITFYMEKNINLWGGIAVTVPINNNKNNFKKFANVIIGGPLASLFFGVVCLLINIALDKSFLLLLGFMSVGISVASLIPMKVRAGGFYTDGGKWLRIIRNKKDRLIEVTLFNIIQSYYVNGDYSKLNNSEIQVLIEDDDPTNKYFGHYYAMHYYNDNKDMDNANMHNEYMKKIKGRVPKNLVKMLSED